jgi:hypothetical protein
MRLDELNPNMARFFCSRLVLAKFCSFEKSQAAWKTFTRTTFNLQGIKEEGIKKNGEGGGEQ